MSKLATPDRPTVAKPAPGFRVRWECRMCPQLAAELERNAGTTHRTETAVVERALRAYLARKEHWR